MAETLIHFVVCEQDKEPAIDQSSGAEINKRHGAVVPIRASGGKQDFACEVDMSKHAGKLYEGANHHGTGDAQFVNCPMCKETEEYKKAFADHESHTREDRGRFAGIFKRATQAVHTSAFDKQRANAQGGTEGVVGGSGASEQPTKTVAPAGLSEPVTAG